MAIKYKSVVPWGRSYQEYVGMFKLSESDLDKKILGCGDGPASFNSVMKKRDKPVVSIDPIYQFSTAAIEKRIEDTYPVVIDQTRQHLDKFIWTRIRNIEELAEIRMKAMREFLKDYETGKNEGRYIYAELPTLPFEDDQFDLVLSAHFLFFYSDNLTYEFHLQSIEEMLRVAPEVRIFPLLDVNAVRSPYADRLIDRYSNRGFNASEIKVDYEFQKKGNTMLKIERIHNP